jgi:CYTH domain-containing protein
MPFRTGEDEARDPKYAHAERERRWLVDPRGLPDLTSAAHIFVEDRYIDDTRLRLRRMTHGATGVVALKLTKKYEAADALARPIVTAYLDEREYAVFAALPARLLTKYRYHVWIDNREFSYDRFSGHLVGLHLLEIEWTDDAGLRALQPPGWAMREVSEDVRYQGGTLVREGIPGDRI